MTVARGLDLGSMIMGVDVAVDAVVQVKVERMRSHANEKLMNKLAATRRHAEDRRAKAEALRGEQASKTASRADQIRRTGKIPTPLFGHLCG